MKLRDNKARVVGWYGPEGRRRRMVLRMRPLLIESNKVLAGFMADDLFSGRGYPESKHLFDNVTQPRQVRVGLPAVYFRMIK